MDPEPRDTTLIYKDTHALLQHIASQFEGCTLHLDPDDPGYGYLEYRDAAGTLFILRGVQPHTFREGDEAQEHDCISSQET